MKNEMIAIKLPIKKGTRNVNLTKLTYRIVMFSTRMTMELMGCPTVIRMLFFTSCQNFICKCTIMEKKLKNAAVMTTVKVMNRIERTLRTPLCLW